MDEPKTPVRKPNWWIEAPIGFLFSFVIGCCLMNWAPMPLPTALKVVGVTGIVILIFRLARKQANAQLVRSVISTIGFGCGVLAAFYLS